MTDPVPPVPVASARRSLWDRVSVIWLIPLGAVLVALGVAWQSFETKGPLVRIEFEDAAGLQARESELRFRDVAVGVVEQIQFTPDLDRVVASVRVDPGIADYLDDDAQFWIVQPEITTQRITGLETVLSGVFIEGSWDDVPEGVVERHEGIATAPLLRAGQEGLEITLRSTDGTLTSTMPLLYKGVTVGQVGEPLVGDDGVSVTAQAVIFAPFDRLVTEATVFWDASGFSLSLGAAGAEVDFDSISSLLIGGLAFDSFVSGARPAEDGDVFEAYLYEDWARDAIYADPNSPVLELMAVFSGRIAGLAVGAPIELGGLRIGEVVDVDGLIDPDRFGDEEVHLQAVLSIQPARLGLEGEEGRDAILRLLTTRIEEQGLRARLATGSLLGGLKVELVPVPDLPPGTIDLAALPFPALPVAPANVTDFAGTAQGLLERVDNLPVEQVLDSAVSFLDNAAVLVGSPETQAIPGKVGGILDDVRAVTASPAVQTLPDSLDATLARIDGTLAGAQALLATIEEQDGVGRVLATVDRAGTALDAVGTAAEGVPDLLARLSALADKANALAIEPLLDEAAGAAADLRALLAQPAVQALPDRVTATLDEAAGALADARTLVASVNAADLGPRLSQTLDSARSALAAVDAAAQGAPQLMERLDAIAAEVQGLDLDPLVTEATGAAADLRALLQAPGMQELPARLNALADEATLALADARGILATVNDADLAQRLANAITAGEEAATAVRDAAERLPSIAERIDALVAKAEALPLEDLVERLASLATSADAFVSSEATQALPGDLSAALADLRAVLTEVREGGTVQNLNALLASARGATDALPGLVDRASATLAQAGAAFDAVAAAGGVVDDAESAIREVSRAAGAVADLARAIERDPNSLIFGD